MHYETRTPMGNLPINPVRTVGRYALKYITQLLTFEWMVRVLCVTCSNTMTTFTSDTYRVHTRSSDRGCAMLNHRIHGYCWYLSPSLLWQINFLASQYSRSVSKHFRLIEEHSTVKCGCELINIKPREIVSKECPKNKNK